MKDNTGRRWYLTALAAVYLALCSVGCLSYLSLQFRSDAGTVPVPQQALCLAFAIAAGTYFMRARVGHIALTVLTVLTLVGIGTTNPGATAFHLFILLVLAVPLMRKRKDKPSANNELESIVA
jgi:hypothetical protein